MWVVTVLNDSVHVHRDAVNDCCRRLIRMLDAEKKELLTDLHLARSPLNNVKDNKIVSQIVRLLNLTDKYDAEIQSEKLQVITCSLVT